MHKFVFLFCKFTIILNEIINIILFKYNSCWYSLQSCFTWWILTHTGEKFSDGHSRQAFFVSFPLSVQFVFFFPLIVSVTEREVKQSLMREEGKTQIKNGGNWQSGDDRNVAEETPLDLPESHQTPFHSRNPRWLRWPLFLQAVAGKNEKINFFSLFQALVLLWIAFYIAWLVAPVLIYIGDAKNCFFFSFFFKIFLWDLRVLFCLAVKLPDVLF